MRVLFFLLFATLLLSVSYCPTEAQIKDALKKGGKKVLKGVFGNDENQTQDDNNPTQNEPHAKNPSAPAKGKKLTPPDVNQHLGSANSALQASQYSQSRYEIKQALMGVELEIGHEILKSLPTTVDGLNYQPENDQVYSSGAGFMGLVIGRDYGNNNKQCSAIISNNSLYVGAYGAFLGNSGYSGQNGEAKSVMVQGNRAWITFDQDSTYELIVPIGQTTVFVLKCEGFADENTVTNAANAFDLTKIKALLGEQ
ncbi:MAG: hypothetical protein HC880_06870 [Bacteroidia bacterium]|nr:hypothetical protein [Bacteroidia bacterium]